MNLSDKFLVGFIILWNFLVVLFWLVGLHGWTYLWLAIEGVVGIGEFISYKRTGRTLTQKFRWWAGQHVWQAVILLILMASAWVLLLLHLGVR